MESFVGTAFDKIINTGVVGAVLVLSLLANYWQLRRYDTLMEKRIADLQQAQNVIIAPLTSMKQTVEMMLTLLQERKRP